MSSFQTGIQSVLMRGGTSRGVYFMAEDLPAESSLRDSVLLAVMGGPDDLRVDGIGGGHPLTNKVAIVAPSARAGADIDYLFLQVLTREQRVSDGQNCGNILAGVAPFAIDSGLVSVSGNTTTVRVHMLNSGNIAELVVQTPNGRVAYDGDARIDGVPGTAAPVVCDFLDIAGALCGSLLPTGNTADLIDGVEVTCIDNGMPVVMLNAEALKLSGYELPEDLESDAVLKAKLETIRLKAGPIMNLGDVGDKTVPKICLVAAPREGGALSTRMFIPHVCHRSIGVLGAVTAATGCLLPGSVAAAVADVPEGDEKNLLIEHPGGFLGVRLVADGDATPEKLVKRAGVIRTARMIMRGTVFVPASVWDGGLQSGSQPLRTVQ